LFSSTTSLFKVTPEAEDDSEHEEEDDKQDDDEGGVRFAIWRGEPGAGPEYNKTRIHRSTRLKRRELTLVEVRGKGAAPAPSPLSLSLSVCFPACPYMLAELLVILLSSTAMLCSAPVYAQDWKVDEAVEQALQCVFRDGQYLPADPFQLLLQAMRRQERATAGGWGCVRCILVYIL
jgi:hypothetical protein